MTLAASPLSCTGYVAITSGRLVHTNGTLEIGASGVGQVILGGGSIETRSAQLGNAAGSQGLIDLRHGTMSVSQSLQIGTSLAYPGYADIGSNAVLLVTNAARTSSLTISKGSVSLAGGLVQADSLVVPKVGGGFYFNSGSLILRNATVSNGQMFIAGDGLAKASLNFLPGNYSFPSGLLVSSNAVLNVSCDRIDGPLINQGTIIVNCPGGVFIANGPFSNRGTIVASNGTTIQFYGPVLNEGIITAVNGGAVQFYSSIENHHTLEAPVTGPPAIIAQPESQDVSQWDTASLEVVVAGSPNLRYRWSFRGTNIPTATNASYVQASIQPAASGNYQVMVANSFGSITSAVAVLRVNPPPSAGVAGTKVLVNGVVVLRDDYENAPVLANPAAEFGSWVNISGPILVTNIGYPGPYEGSKYLQILGASPQGGGSLQSVLGKPAIANDVFRFETMAYVSPLAYGHDYPFQFVAYNTSGVLAGTSQSPLHSWLGVDGTVYYYNGEAGSPTQTHIRYGQWQYWEIEYVVGSGHWSWLVDGAGDTNIGVNGNAQDRSIGAIHIFGNSTAGTNAPLYLDGVPELALQNSRLEQGLFRCDFRTLPGKYYFLEWSAGLTAGSWQPASSVIVGDGSAKLFSETPLDQQRFYRLRRE
jgi:hypothetical protein